MSKIVWDATGERFFETGVDQAVLYILNENNEYNNGVAWNGITSITESPSGADANPLYADNIKYLNLIAAEDFGATIEAYTYPDEWAQCDGSAELATGINIGQQSRKTFGLCYRTKIGNDVLGQEKGYKLHLIYGGLASPSDRSYQTINDNPDAITFSWTITTTPVNVTGHKATACLTIDSTKIAPAKLRILENALYGTNTAAAVDAVYAATTDTAPQSGKTYYTKSGNVYTEFSGDSFTAGTTYYVMTSPAAPATTDAAPYLPLPDAILSLIA